MPALDAASFAVLERLVLEQDKHTETECEPYLVHAAGYLIQATRSSIRAVRQDRNYFGTGDVILIASILNETMQVVDYASIWELKAPQCYLMEFDDSRNRCRPTVDLIKAETQLLHYGHESQNNDAQRSRLKIMDRDRIVLGGIVIGTKDRILRGAQSNGDIERAMNSLNIRTKYFYQPSGIKIVTWDRIVEYLRPV